MNASNLRPLLAFGILAVPGVATAHHLPAYGSPYSSTVTVRNDTPVGVETVVDGQRLSLSPSESRTVAVSPGAVSITTTYRQFGRVYSLPYQSRYVRRGEREFVELDAPGFARIEVRNTLPRCGEVLVDGRAVARLDAYETEILTLSVGTARLDFSVDGRVLATTRESLQPMTDERWTVSAPAVADLVVTNPLPIPVVVTAGHDQPRTLQPGGRVQLDVAVTESRIVARRLTGELVDQGELHLDPYRLNQYTVQPPDTGLVQLDNDAGVPVVIQDRGRTLVSLSPGEERRLTLCTGWHELAVVDVYGRTLDREWIEVRPYDTVRFDAEADHRRPDESHGHGHGHEDGDGVSQRDDGHRRPDDDGSDDQAAWHH